MPEQRVLIAVDVVGSTEIKERAGQQNGIRKITAAMQRIELALKAVDSGLKRSYGIAGDALLLINGREALELYYAATDQQALFCNRPKGRLPIKIAFSYGVYEEERDSEGRISYFGSDLDYLHRMLSYCPNAGIVVNNAFFGLMEDHGEGERFIAVREVMRGIGDGAPQLFYESRGGYVIPPNARQPADRRKAQQAEAGVPRKRRFWQW